MVFIQSKEVPVDYVVDTFKCVKCLYAFNVSFLFSRVKNLTSNSLLRYSLFLRAGIVLVALASTLFNLFMSRTKRATRTGQISSGGLTRVFYRVAFEQSSGASQGFCLPSLLLLCIASRTSGRC